MTKTFATELAAGQYADANRIDRRHLRGRHLTVASVGGKVVAPSHNTIKGGYMRTSSW